MKKERPAGIMEQIILLILKYAEDICSDNIALDGVEWPFISLSKTHIDMLSSGNITVIKT